MCKRLEDKMEESFYIISQNNVQGKMEVNDTLDRYIIIEEKDSKSAYHKYLYLIDEDYSEADYCEC